MNSCASRVNSTGNEADRPRFHCYHMCNRLKGAESSRISAPPPPSRHRPAQETFETPAKTKAQVLTNKGIFEKPHQLIHAAMQQTSQNPKSKT